MNAGTLDRRRQRMESARSDPRRLYAVLQPLGTWLEPCVVSCECGWSVQVATCPQAQHLAWAHDGEHWAGRAGALIQGELFER